jgi:hypothetical protein
MASRQANFYATYNDIAEVLRQFEAQEPIMYVLTGLFDDRTPTTFQTYKAINSLSVSVDGNVHLIPSYLIVVDPRAIVIRKVPQRAGGTLYAIDQLAIPDSLYFRSGGLFSDKMIVPGKIGIAHQTPISRKLYRAFARHLAKSLSKIKSYYVGPEAHALWQNGMRLGLSLRASNELDLKP